MFVEMVEAVTWEELPTRDAVADEIDGNLRFGGLLLPSLEEVPCEDDWPKLDGVLAHLFRDLRRSSSFLPRARVVSSLSLPPVPLSLMGHVRLPSVGFPSLAL